MTCLSAFPSMLTRGAETLTVTGEWVVSEDNAAPKDPPCIPEMLKGLLLEAPIALLKFLIFSRPLVMLS